MNTKNSPRGSDELEKELAERLREANTGGVTRWLGLPERLDFGVISELPNPLKLLRDRLREKLSESPHEEVAADTREKAERLLETLDALAGLRVDDNSDGSDDGKET